MSKHVAIVTGGGQGIGLGIARALAEAGFQVAPADIDPDRARSAAEDLKSRGAEAIPLTLDVTDVASWSRAVAEVVDRFGRLDVLVNNAGISPRGTAESTDEALWDRTMAINLKGPWLGIKTAMPWLRQTRGAIINIGSTRATRPRRGMVAYGASKAGLLGLTRQVAVDGLDDGVTCTMVAPGWVDTPGERIIQAAHGRPEFPEGTRNLITIEEVGAAVVYLVSPPGRRVNGDIVYVDSGLHASDNAETVHLPPQDARGYT
ncbi:MAG: dehydrogenase, short-chain alcohol dehydrogenase like protein [Planctomycetota bacterium]|nr:dehydrogenase, short-chain alcohol dehydrogenase like protein [Planctomycetota bacterium]